MTTGKTVALTRWTFVGKVTSLLFNMLSRLVITFLPRSKRLLISWLQSPFAVILEAPPRPRQFCHCFYSFSIYFPCNDGPDAMILVFWMLSFKPTFSLSSFTFIKRLFRWASNAKESSWRKVSDMTGNRRDKLGKGSPALIGSDYQFTDKSETCFPKTTIPTLEELLFLLVHTAGN